MNRKRFLLITILIVFLFSVITMVNLFGASSGDVNNDGKINIVDSLLIAQYIVGQNPQGFNTSNADINGDNKIDIKDALIIAQISTGIITPTNQISPSPSVNKNFIVTKVADDLNPNDMYLFADKMKQLGYTETARNNNVNKSTLKDYIENYNVEVLYHTGHGLSGGIDTSDQMLYYSEISKINVRNLISATCLTLDTQQWKNKFSNNTNSMLGYTNYSFDGVDNDVVNDFVNELGNGKSYIMSWYLANNKQSWVSDRWCGYVREGNNIVEYSARTGITPKSLTDDNLKKISEKISIKAEIYGTDLINNSKAYTIREDKIKQNCNITDFSKLTDTSITAEEAKKIAASLLNKNKLLSDEAVLDDIIKIQKEGKTIAYEIKYKRVYNGLPICSNFVPEHISVLINKDSILSISKKWSTLEALNEDIDSFQTLSADLALEKAVPEIQNIIKSYSVIIISISNCYGIDRNRLIPAYSILTSANQKIIISAENAEIIGF